jgi:hypothetical protein
VQPQGKIEPFESALDQFHVIAIVFHEQNAMPSPRCGKREQNGR